jgi:hypothetical protein
LRPELEYFVNNGTPPVYMGFGSMPAPDPQKLIDITTQVLFYFILFYFILFYFILFYFILFYFILFYFILFYFILFYFIIAHIRSFPPNLSWVNK